MFTLKEMYKCCELTATVSIITATYFTKIKVLGFLIDHYDSIELVLLLLPERLKLILPIQESHVCCSYNSITITHNSLITLNSTKICCIAVCRCINGISVLNCDIALYYLCIPSSWNSHCQAKSLSSALRLPHSTPELHRLVNYLISHQKLNSLATIWISDSHQKRLNSDGLKCENLLRTAQIFDWLWKSLPNESIS